jgi:short-chain Z-isoprenyl diphosphate synthase
VGLRSAVYAAYERRLRAQLVGRPKPVHVAVMLDGNRRWARAMGLDDVNHGHRVGASHIGDLVEWCRESGVGHVTLFLLSTDNLTRPRAELDPLLRIIEGVADELSGPGLPWRVTAVGSLDTLPVRTATALKEAEERTRERTGMRINVAVGYGDVEHIAAHLYTKGQPDPDLVIRTSGEQRLSGFLLWQSANSEFYFCDALWPDFRKVDFLRALRDYSERQRRFGG